MKEKQTEIGVVIGRFQLHELHQAHIDLIETVLANHDKVILFLGTTTAINTRKNPLDFITRKTMIESYFSTRISAILPLPDQRLDDIWSNQITSKVREIFPQGSVTLYGSRDSFIPYYKGGWKCVELEPTSYVNATDIREKISKQTLSSSDFRAGIIYSIYNQYPTVYSTVDILIVRHDEILLGRKPNEQQWRLIGGFVDPTDESDIDACKREVREETGLEVSDLKFICSKRIKDWRYSNVTDKSIMTRFYSAKYIFGAPEPKDDIAELRWFKSEVMKRDVEYCNIVPEHRELIREYFNSLELCAGKSMEI